MLSAADSVIVFVLALVVIFVILLVATSINSARSRSRAPQGTRSEVGVEIPTEQASVAKRLDPSGSTPKGADPRGADIGGNYN